MPLLLDSISSWPPISFTRSCMLGMPTPSPKDNFPFCLRKFLEIPLPLSLISKVIFPGSRSIRILAWELPECRWMLVRLYCTTRNRAISASGFILPRRGEISSLTSIPVRSVKPPA